MVLDLLSLAIGLPASTGVATGVSVAISETVRRQDRTERDEKWRGKTFHLDVYCNARSRKRDLVNGTVIVLKDNKLWLAPKDSKTNLPLPMEGDTKACQPFTGFYLDYVGERPNVDPMFERLNRAPKIRGLVTTIARDAATLEWTYVDRKTQEVKYGSKEQAQGHLLGPFGWTEDQLGLTLEHWEGFVAVEEKRNVFAIYYDRDDDGLRDVVVRTRVLQCSLERLLIDNAAERPTESKLS